MIVALGTGIFAALGSTAVWRRASNDASFAVANIHDLKLRLSTGTTAPQGTLLEIAHPLASTASITAAEERLVWPTQYEMATATGSELVSGELVGAGPGATVDQTVLRAGSETSDTASGLLELNFARARHLPTAGTVTVGGGMSVTYTGAAMAPEFAR
jgi:putative ABC transport system permease protein